MNPDIKTEFSLQQTTNCEEQILEKEFHSFNKQRQRNEKIKIQIKFAANQKIIYSLNGEVLRIVEALDVLEKAEIFNNMDQIHNLQQQSQYDQYKKKEGKWIASWNKTLLKNTEGQSLIILYILYYKEGQKQGIWQDLFQNYSNQSQIFEVGEYQNDIRIGRWNFIQQERKMHIFKNCSRYGGFYNKNGQKQGKWEEVDEGFLDYKSITSFGEYNMDAMKVVIWDILYCDPNKDREYKQIIFKYKYMKWWWII